MESQAERAARNEATFRETNESIESVAERFQARENDFLCECSDNTCGELIRLGLDEYERVRARGTTFVLRPGHEDTAVERVVEHHRDRYVVVEKTGAGAAVAAELDPRG